MLKAATKLAFTLLLTSFVVVPAARADETGGASQPLMYWGGTIKGSVYGESGEAANDPSVLERFEADAGKKVTFINTGQSWVSFDSAAMNTVIAEGAIPLVTMPLGSGITLREVIEGKQDQRIREWARAARAFGYPFLFRPWWEVNGNWYSWGRSPDYVAAWRHFHDLVEVEGATNVTWAWVVNSIWYDPSSEPDHYYSSNPTRFYPGDEYVDWVGEDAYNWGLNPLQTDKWRTPEEVIEPTLKILREIAPTKPVCICEDASTEMGGDKAAWITHMLGTYLPAHPAIKAYLYFNWNVEQTGKGGEWDWPIESSTRAEAAFHAGIQASTYLATRPPLTKLAKVPMPVEPPPVPVESPPTITVPPPAAPPAPPRSTAPGMGPTCVVPKLKHLTLRSARRRVRAAHCQIGRIRVRGGAKGGPATVASQSPPPGKALGGGAKVSVAVVG